MTVLGRNGKVEMTMVNCNGCGKALDFMVDGYIDQNIASIKISVVACEDCIDAAVSDALYYQDKSKPIMRKGNETA